MIKDAALNTDCCVLTQTARTLGYNHRNVLSAGPGRFLGPYELLSRIGAGGMSEVYRARDTRLGREVAIKICANQFSDRFEQEARAIAALNHPNICRLYDVGPNYLVMELIEGEVLHGPLPTPTAVNYACQIAAALETAHELGIIHRDLKPANIMASSSGVVSRGDTGEAACVGPLACVDRGRRNRSHFGRARIRTLSRSACRSPGAARVHSPTGGNFV
jgi:serine/threonine protein kinase